MPGAGNPQSLNRYSYVNNRPLNMVDPSGHVQTDPNGCDPTSCGHESYSYFAPKSAGDPSKYYIYEAKRKGRLDLFLRTSTAYSFSKVVDSFLESVFKKNLPFGQNMKYDNVFSFGTTGYNEYNSVTHQEYGSFKVGGVGFDIGFTTTTGNATKGYIAPSIGVKGIASADIQITKDSVEIEGLLLTSLGGGEGAIGIEWTVPDSTYIAVRSDLDVNLHEVVAKTLGNDWTIDPTNLLGSPTSLRTTNTGNYVTTDRRYRREISIRIDSNE